MNDKVDKSIERTYFYHADEKAPDICPRCAQPLVEDYGPYHVATRNEKDEIDEFIIGGDYGYLCVYCATAVFHIPVLMSMLQVGAEEGVGQSKSFMFAVLGLVNLAAIPPDQADIPIDELDPYPLVPYRAYSEPNRKHAVRRKRPKRKRIRRK